MIQVYIHNHIRLIKWYLHSMLWGILLALAVYLVLLPQRRKQLRRRGLRSPLCREIALCLFWMFVGGMAVLTLLPYDWWNFPLTLGHGIPLTPFFSPGTVNLTFFRTFGENFVTLLGNIVMFLPFGFCAALLWRGWTGRRALLAGFGITAFIECWQLLIGRAFDIDDLLLNTLGTFLGWCLWRGLASAWPGRTKRFHCQPAGIQ